MKFTTQVSDFESFLDRVRGQGNGLDEQESTIADDALVLVKEQGLKCVAQNQNETVIAVVRHQVEDVSETGQLPIGSIERLEDYLNRFKGSDEVVIAKESIGDQGTRITITRENPRKTAKVNAVDADDIESHLPEDHARLTEKFVYDDEEDTYTVNIGEEQTHEVKATFQSSDLVEVLEDGKLVSAVKVPFIAQDDGVEVSIGDEKISGFESKIEGDVEFNDEDAEGKTYGFGEGLENVFPHIDGEVDLYLIEGVPAWVKCKTDEYRADYLMAPLTDE